MTKFFNKFKKTLAYFWSIFPILGAKKIVLENPTVTHNVIWVSSTIPKFGKKLMILFDTISRKHPDRQKTRRNDRPYFIRPFWVPPEV